MELARKKEKVQWTFIYQIVHKSEFQQFKTMLNLKRTKAYRKSKRAHKFYDFKLTP
jgi:hypothetical protein